MVSVGGPAVMLLGAALAAVLCVLLGLVLRRPLGRVRGWSVSGLLWTALVIGLVTLVPAHGAPGIIPADQAQTTCSFDLGGPAPDGFWILGGGQRLLNTALFVPSGFLLVLAVVRRRTRWLLLPGLVLLAAYSAGIELTQLELTRLDRACDVTDLVDNATGALIGGLLGTLVVALPWALRPHHPGAP